MVSRKMTRLLDCCLFSLDMDFCPEVQPAQKRKIKFNCTVDESNIWKFSSSSTHASWALVDLFILRGDFLQTRVFFWKIAQN